MFPRQGPSELRLSCHRDPHVQDGVLHRYTQVGNIDVLTKCNIFFIERVSGKTGEVIYILTNVVASIHRFVQWDKIIEGNGCK